MDCFTALPVDVVDGWEATFRTVQGGVQAQEFDWEEMHKEALARL